MAEEPIHAAFIRYASTVLTDQGLTGPKLVEITAMYAVDFHADIPHARYPFDSPNKRSALHDNLAIFAPKQQYQIIRELCDRVDPSGTNLPIVRLKAKLQSEYAALADQDQQTEMHQTLLIETKHWLGDHPRVRKLFDEALQKHDAGLFRRNTLDDLRLALELLLCELFSNGKTLENQLSAVGVYVRELNRPGIRGGHLV